VPERNLAGLSLLGLRQQWCDLVPIRGRQQRGRVVPLGGDLEAKPATPVILGALNIQTINLIFLCGLCALGG